MTHKAPTPPPENIDKPATPPPPPPPKKGANMSAAAKAAEAPPEYTVHDQVYPPKQAIGPAWDGTTQNGKWWVKVGNGFYGHLNALGDVQHDCCWFDTCEEANQAIAVYRERRQQATDATHSELEQLRERVKELEAELLHCRGALSDLYSDQQGPLTDAIIAAQKILYPKQGIVQ